MPKTYTQKLIDANLISPEAIEENNKMDEKLKLLEKDYLIQNSFVEFSIDDTKKVFENLCSREVGKKRRMEPRDEPNSFKIIDKVSLKTVYLLYLDEQRTRVVIYVYTGSGGLLTSIGISRIAKKTIKDLSKDLEEEFGKFDHNKKNP